MIQPTPPMSAPAMTTTMMTAGTRRMPAREGEVFRRVGQPVQVDDGGGEEEIQREGEGKRDENRAAEIERGNHRREQQDRFAGEQTSACRLDFQEKRPLI